MLVSYVHLPGVPQVSVPDVLCPRECECAGLADRVRARLHAHVPQRAAAQGLHCRPRLVQGRMFHFTQFFWIIYLHRYHIRHKSTAEHRPPLMTSRSVTVAHSAHMDCQPNNNLW